MVNEESLARMQTSGFDWKSEKQLLAEKLECISPERDVIDRSRIPSFKHSRPVLITRGRVASWTPSNAAPTMTRRIVRFALQLAALSAFVFFLVIFLDNRYDVLPNAIHNHLPQHHPGHVITDVTVKTCSNLNPFSSCQLDPTEWLRIHKDLYLGTSWSSKSFLHLKHKQEEYLKVGDKVVLDIKVSRLDPSQDAPHGHEQWESRPGGIWLLRSSKRHESDSKRAITAVDVLFGLDATDPRPGWTLRSTPLLLDGVSSNLEPFLSARSGSPKPPSKPVLKINEKGRFKIMQAADLHLSTGFGTCRDSDSHGHKCEADTRTLDFVGKMLDQEKPDLVVLTGDQVNGDTALDPQSAILKMADVFIKRQIPYASIFGNHDDLGALSRSDSMRILESLPYSLAESGPAAVTGVGNYVVEVQAPGSSHHSAISLYLLDTHGASPDEAHFPGYNWLKDNQIQWFKEKSEGLKQKHRNYAKIHLDMAFIHIPLPEYRNVDRHKISGEYRESVTAPLSNSHFKDALVEQGVKLVTAGHDHVNDYCMLDKAEQGDTPQLWMCYGGGAGFGGYGGHGGYTRRIRFFEFDAEGASIRSWKRLESGETEKKIDLQTLVEGGKFVAN